MKTAPVKMCKTHHSRRVIREDELLQRLRSIKHHNVLHSEKTNSINFGLGGGGKKGEENSGDEKMKGP